MIRLSPFSYLLFLCFLATTSCSNENREAANTKMPIASEQNNENESSGDMSSDKLFEKEYQNYISSLPIEQQKSIRGNEELEYFLFHLGETTKIERIIESNTERTDSYWRSRWNNDTKYLKYLILKKKAPDIIVVGASTMNQFTQGMFEPYSFYNMCTAATNFQDALGLLESLAVKPKVLIFALEAYKFNQPIRKKNEATEWENIDTLINRPKIYNKARKFISKNSASKEWVDDIEAGTKYLGVKSYEKKRGFRSIDGSVYWGDIQESTTQSHTLKYNALKKKSQSDFKKKKYFLPRELMSPDFVFGKWNMLVEKAKEMDVRVIGFTPPLSQPHQDILDADDSKFAWWAEFQKPETGESFRKGDGLYFNFSRFNSFDGDKLMMIDLIHPSEPSIALCVAKMLDDPEVKSILPKIDKEFIKSQAQKVGSEYPLGEVFK